MRDDDESGEQLSLEDVMSAGLVRHSDPYTSKEAAADQTEWKLNRVRAKVLIAMLDAGPITDDQIYTVVGGSPSSLRTRRHELQMAGFVRPAGEGLSRFGKPALLWILTDRGETYVRDNRGLLIQKATT